VALVVAVVMAHHTLAAQVIRRTYLRLRGQTVAQVEVHLLVAVAVH
jgi:hypothetical protein